MNMNLSNLWETVKDREGWHAAVHGAVKSQNDCATEQPQKKPNLVFISNKIDPVIWPLQLILNSFLHQVGKKKYSFYFLNV